MVSRWVLIGKLWSFTLSGSAPCPSGQAGDQRRLKVGPQREALDPHAPRLHFGLARPGWGPARPSWASLDRKLWPLTPFVCLPSSYSPVGPAWPRGVLRRGASSLRARPARLGTSVTIREIPCREALAPHALRLHPELLRPNRTGVTSRGSSAGSSDPSRSPSSSRAPPGTRDSSRTRRTPARAPRSSPAASSTPGAEHPGRQRGLEDEPLRDALTPQAPWPQGRSTRAKL